MSGTREPAAQPPQVRVAFGPMVKALVSIALIAMLFSRIDGATLLSMARTAAPSWLAMSILIYLAMILASAWRWGVLLSAQRIQLPFRTLTSSFLVATFFNNFLPSNIGGDVVRIADTARSAGSKTLATTVVLIDRGIGLLGLILIAAVGASAWTRPDAMGPVGPGLLWLGLGVGTVIATPALANPRWFARMLQPLRRLHPEWISERIARLTAALVRFRETPAALAQCFAGAVLVQALLVAFYFAIAYSLRVDIAFADLAFIVPVTFIVQMLPVSMNGFGVREATFGFYFGRLGLPLESALLVSLMGAAMIMLFSLSGAAVYVGRRRAAA
jgi:glycosyltransferase 2 family protein